MLIGIPLALLSASRPDSLRDAAAQTVGLLGLAIPSFLLGSLLIAYVSRWFRYNPNSLAFARLNLATALVDTAFAVASDGTAEQVLRGSVP